MVQATAPRPETGVAPEARVGRRDGRTLADREGFLAWAMLLPSVIYIVALVGVPLFLAIAFSFSDVTAGDPSFDWAGLANYQRIFDDPVFWRSLRNTIIFTAGSMVLIVVFGKVIANILVADFRGKWIVRFLVLLPWTTPVALSAICWLWMLDSIFSPIDWMLREVGLINGNMYSGRRRSEWPDGVKRAAVRWVVVPFALGTLAYFGLGQLPAAITGRPLIPWTWFRGLFILVLAAMTVSVVRNHLLEGADCRPPMGATSHRTDFRDSRRAGAMAFDGYAADAAG